MESLSAKETASKTFVYDCIRGPFNSFVYMGLMTLALLVAKRGYDAPSYVMSIIQGADSFGRLITPITLYIGFLVGLRTSMLIALYMVLTGLFLIGTGLMDTMAWYAISVVMVYVLFAQPPQLMLHVYSNNYSSQVRGQRVSTMFLLSTGLGLFVSHWFGSWLDVDFSAFHVQFYLLGFFAIISAVFVTQIPSTPLTSNCCGNPWQNFSTIWKDKLFGWMILGYVLLGTANTMIIPIRVEYLADPEFEINASNLSITTINVLVQGVSMIVSMKIWGWIFDKFHFIKTRLIINTCFIVSLLTFFATKDLWLMGASMVVNGFAVGGGMIVWNLWVTKVAPKERVPAYMSAHVSCSGIKGILAPFLGYWVLSISSPFIVGIVAASLMLLSSWMFFHVRKNTRIL